MGYWDQGPRSEGGKELYWGDQPADVLGDAINEMIVNFLRDLRRLPTKEELRRGMEFALGGLDLPETEPTEEYTDDQLTVIDKLGFTAFGGDLPYRGHKKPQRKALDKVMEVVRGFQEPFYTRHTWENQATEKWSVPLADEGEEQQWPEGVK